MKWAVITIFIINSSGRIEWIKYYGDDCYFETEDAAVKKAEELQAKEHSKLVANWNDKKYKVTCYAVEL